MTAKLWLQYALHRVVTALWRIRYRVEKIRQDRRNAVEWQRAVERYRYPNPTPSERTTRA